MRRGLVIGRFMPLHAGHIALIQFAAAHCEELIVIVTSNPGDPIPGDVRLAWVNEEFRRYVRIKPELLEDLSFSLSAETQLEQWAAIIKSRFPSIELIFSSSPFGQSLARHLHAAHAPFDPERSEHQGSSTQIREHPFRYWEFIAKPARGHFVKRICFNGPESTGKSTLAKRMAEQYQTEFVPEVAREIISSNQFTAGDIIKIGEAQTTRVLEKTAIANRLLFCDTDLITTAVYSSVYLGMVPEILYELEKKIRYDYYFLFDIDVPWVNDGLRDLGAKRKEMLERFKGELEHRGIPYILLSGSFAERERCVVQFVEKLLAS